MLNVKTCSNDYSNDYSATSRFGRSLLGTSWYVFKKFQIGHFHLGTT